MKTKNKIMRIIVYLLTLFVMLIMFAPIYWMISVSIRPLNQTFEPTLFPRTIDLTPYIKILSNKNLRIPFLNSILVSTTTTAIGIMIGLPASYSLSRYSSKINQVVMTTILSSKMFPPVFLIISYFFLASKVKLYDNLISVIIVDTVVILPFMVWMMKNYFDTIPRELDEAAIIDGSTRIGALFRIVLPISSPGLAATITYGFLLTWNEFLFAFTLTASGNNRVVPVQIMSYLGEYTKNYSDLLSTSVLFIIPIIILFVLMQRYLIQGLAAGSVIG